MKHVLRSCIVYFLIIIMMFTFASCSGGSDEESKKASDLPAAAGTTADPSVTTVSSGHKLAVNKDAGFFLEYDSGYTVGINPGSIMVYTGSDQDIPYYYVAPMRVTDMTTAEYAEYDKNNILEWYSVRLTEEPEIVQYEAGPWKVWGIEYSFSSEDGTAAYRGCHYLVPCGDDGEHMSWTAFFDITDTKTPADMRHAMETFRLMAD